MTICFVTREIELPFLQIKARNNKDDVKAILNDNLKIERILSIYMHLSMYHTQCCIAVSLFTRSEWEDVSLSDVSLQLCHKSSDLPVKIMMMITIMLQQ